MTHQKPPKPRTPTTLADLLRQAIAKDGGSKSEFARAIGLRPSALSHVLKGDYPLGFVASLKVARAAGVSASTVLRAAEHADMAALLEDLYGPPVSREHEWSVAERRLIRLLRQLTRSRQRCVQEMVDGLFKAHRFEQGLARRKREEQEEKAEGALWRRGP